MHTPGPWYDERTTKSIRSVANMRREDGRKPFCICRYPTRTNTSAVSHQEWESNACLIAAAPELLEALKDLMELRGIIEERCGDAETYRAARIIAKAEGKP